ncbi:MAG: glycosyltransferase family 4 protein [Planctomycetota bacterium]|nr:glycosyltransferase family 4 protein [Planctomycetota bacterium]
MTSVAGNGGSAHTAFQTARLLAKAGHTATLFAPGNYWAERGAREGVAVNSSLTLRRGFHPASFFRDFARLRRFLAGGGADVLIVQKSPEQWLAHYVLTSLRKHVALVRARGVVFPIKPSGFNRRLHNRMDLVVCSAQVIAEQYKNLPGFRMEHVKVLLEGVDTARFSPATPEQRKAARAAFQLDPHALIIGTAGRPSPVKGHDLLVEAFAKACGRASVRAHDAHRRPANVRLCIFSDESRRGPGSYPTLRDLAERDGIAAHVDFRPGYIEDMRSVYHALDAYILPSRGSEGSSRAGLEASSSGLPLIASRVGVLPDLVDDGVTGRLVPPDNLDALTAELEGLIEAWPAGQKLGAAARARILDRFKEEDYVARLVSHLQAAIEGKP